MIGKIESECIWTKYSPSSTFNFHAIITSS